MLLYKGMNYNKHVNLEITGQRCCQMGHLLGVYDYQ